MSNTRRLWVPGQGSKRLVRNQLTERVLPCCYGPCDADGDARVRVEVPHNQPRWKDEATDKQEMLVYIFCTDEHKRLYLIDSPYANRA